MTEPTRIADEQEPETMNILQPQTTKPMQVITPQARDVQPTTGRMVGGGKTTPERRGSGQVTNIRKYIEAGRPQTQQMAQSVAGRQEQKAQQIGQQIQQQKQQYSQDIASQQEKLGQQQQFTQQQIAAAQAGQSPEESDLQRFQRIIQESQSFQPTEQINLAQQQARTEALQRLAGQAPTERGRYQLLEETYGDKGRYTRGMSGLDNLLLSSSPEAAQTIQTGVKQAAQNVGRQLQQAKFQSTQELGKLGEDTRGLLEDVTGQLQTGITGIQENVAQREEQLEQLTQNVLTGLETGQFTPEALQAVMSTPEGQQIYNNLIEGFIPEAINRQQQALSGIPGQLQSYLTSSEIGDWRAGQNYDQQQLFNLIQNADIPEELKPSIVQNLNDILNYQGAGGTNIYGVVPGEKLYGRAAMLGGPKLNILYDLIGSQLMQGISPIELNQSAISGYDLSSVLGNDYYRDQFSPYLSSIQDYLTDRDVTGRQVITEPESQRLRALSELAGVAGVTGVQPELFTDLEQTSRYQLPETDLASLIEQLGGGAKVSAQPLGNELFKV